MGASLRDLAALGYVEEEYFLTGSAAQFAMAPDATYGPDGRWDVVTREPTPFRTRFLVRRPVDPARFNGTVVVHWNNVSLGLDFLGRMSTEIFTAGSAWVGATVQKIAIEGFPTMEHRGLVGWDAERYGDLSILDDDASFDIFTQIGRAVGPDRLGAGSEGVAGVDPMGGLPVTQLLAIGESQSANRLGTYYNAIQPLSKVFNGFLVIVYSGGGTRVEAKGPGPSLEAIPAEFRDIINVLPFGWNGIRTDLDVPLIVLNSETEATWYRPVRQPDTATYRLWEVAGAAHQSGGPGRETEDIWVRDLGENLGMLEPLEGSANALTFEPVANAALRHLTAWVADGTIPPAQERLSFTEEPAKIARDEYGNALGGIRLPDFAVPTASYRGAPRGDEPDLAGSMTPFSPETLLDLYPDHAAYVQKYDRAIDEAIERGFLLEGDAEILRARAADASVPE
jgi:Alpha/beta hydrolase domain